MWDHIDEDEFKKTNEKVHNLIADKLKFKSLEELKKIEDELTQRCINLLCESYRVDKIF